MIVGRELTVQKQGLVLIATLILTAFLVTVLPDQSVARRGVESNVIVQFAEGVSTTEQRTLVRERGGRVTGELESINGLDTRMTGGEAAALSRNPAVIVTTVSIPQAAAHH